MFNKVRVVGSPNGEVITKSINNLDWGYIQVEQERETFDELTGILKIKKLNAVVPGLIKDLERLHWYGGQILQGKIVVREQLLPFNQKDPSKSLKIAGDTSVVCKSGEDVIYRQSFYTPNPNSQDVLIQHTNKEEIREAMLVTPDEEDNKDKDFSLD